MQVTSSIQKVVIPTYEIGTPEKNPIYLENRVYQGSSGAVYPLPVIEKISDTKVDKEWLAIYLENQYLKIMILPELGGRIQMAYDKIKQRHFIYYNQVIKPALVGLTGPWISGGIEFNWPQHHRPSTYDPVDYSVEQHTDGSITVWCSEVERMFRTKGMAGFRLYPDKAYLEINVKLYNRTPHPQTFLWWANPAVKVNDHYQSVFPPDVHAVFDHGKRDVSSFPIATGTYYKVDYSAGVDISKYKNIPVPTSYMAIQSKYDFVGGYENDSRAGVLHVADHHQSPGKKQWTWGNGDFGQAWDRNLTDEDGPYIELMCGVYTDNQPDFSWLQAYEEKSFKQYFMPYQELGLVKNATKAAMLNLEPEKEGMRLKIYTTAEYPLASIQLKNKGEVVYENTTNLSPGLSFDDWIDAPMSSGDTYVAVYDQTGKILVDYQTEQETLTPIPEPARAAKAPEDIHSTEQLYLRGLHLEQYRHATYDPTAYYRKALEIEPGNVRNNNALGLWLMKRGQLAQAEPYFRKAIETLTERNPNPYDGEPYFNLGLCLLFQGNGAEAYDHFFKATWNAAWQDSGFFHCAQIDAQKGDYERALELVDRSLWRNWVNQKARHLKIILLRKLNRPDQALALIQETLAQDRFNFGAIYEKYLLVQEGEILNDLKHLMRGYVHNFIEFSLDYAQAGFFQEALDFIQLYLDNTDAAYPMAYYFKAYYHLLTGEKDRALSSFQEGSKANPAYCFPHRLEELIVLQKALTLNPDDDKAWYYLGNLWYGFRQYEEATEAWEKSRLLHSIFPTVHRNLALAYYNKQNDPAAAQESLEKAFSLDQTDARVFMELDQLYKKQGISYQQRLDLLEQYPNLVEDRDDLYLEKISLLNLLGQETRALDLIRQRKFHPWEGGEGKVTGQYLYSHIALAKKAIASGACQAAVDHLILCFEYPHNLGEGKLYGTQENDLNYWLGCAYEGLGKMEKARGAWEKATRGLSQPAAAMYYNDQQPDKIFYQGLACRKLDKEKEARSRFHKLLKHGEKHLFIPFKMDYFAVSLPDLLIFEDNLQARHELYCHYLMGLGQLGLGNIDKSKAEFEYILEQDKYHLGAFIHLQLARS
jgi:tetratricopeptide (TPR) repeat protein